MSKVEHQCMRPRSINIFLLHGDPDGIRVAQMSMSTIQAIAFRKLKLKQAREAFSDLTRPGVYLLLGFDENKPDEQIAYIGESEDVAQRLKDHTASVEKEFWIETIALVSKDESVTKSHARYVEARLITAAKLNPRWEVRNVQGAGARGKLPLPDQAAMEEFIEQTKMLVGALGCDLFKEISGSVTSSSTVEALEVTELPPEPFQLKGDGYSAQLIISGKGEFWVKKDSIARLKTTDGMPKGMQAFREELLQKSVLVQDVGGLRFAADCLFTSVSAAAAMVTGNSVNGRLVWKLPIPDGRTYAQWDEGDPPAAVMPVSDLLDVLAEEQSS